MVGAVYSIVKCLYIPTPYILIVSFSIKNKDTMSTGAKFNWQIGKEQTEKQTETFNGNRANKYTDRKGSKSAIWHKIIL